MHEAFHWFCLLVIMVACTPKQQQDTKQEAWAGKPNILFIVADDLGSEYARVNEVFDPAGHFDEMY